MNDMNDMSQDKFEALVGKYIDLEKAARSGNNVLACCPFHKDSNPSFSMVMEGDKRGLYNCFACGAKGNLFTFLKKLSGGSVGEVMSLIGGGTGEKSRTSCTLSSFCMQKKFDADVVSRFELSEGRDGAGNSCVIFPYYDARGNVAYKKRRFAGSPKFDIVGKTGCAYPYRAKDLLVAPKGELFICEGETDTISLAACGFQAVGVGGAKGVKSCWPQMPDLGSLDKVRICIDDDESGLMFASEVLSCLMRTRFKGLVDLIWPSDYNDDGLKIKDISDLYVKLGFMVVEGLSDESGETIEYQMERITRMRSAIPNTYAYKLNADYTFKDGQIYREGVDKNGEPVEIKVLSYQLLWNGLFRTDEGRLYVRLKSRHSGVWTDHEMQKSKISKTSELVSAFCESGLPGVSDANGKEVMRYLASCEDCNTGSPIQVKMSVSGWMDEKHYSPFVVSENCIAENDYETSDGGEGWMESWKRLVLPNVGARCVVSSAVGATLLDITGCRSHVVYAYGSSQGGKTAAQVASAAFYGRPEDVMASMYGTVVGIELMATKRNDMALILDERQVVGKTGGQGQSMVEQLVYMLAGGKGKIRGAKDGGLRDIRSWRTVAVISGEESLSKEGSQQGVFSRTLPLYGKPFKDSNAAAKCYPEFGKDFGCFEKWIKMIVSKRREIETSYECWKKYVEEQAAYEGAEISSSHVQYVANMLTADQFLLEMSGMDRVSARKSSMECLIHALSNFKEVTKSYSQRALSALAAFVFTNLSCFKTTSFNTKRYGDMDFDEGYVYITNDGIKEFCAQTGFDAERLKKDWTEENLLDIGQRRICGAARVRTYKIRLSKEDIQGEVDLPPDHIPY